MITEQLKMIEFNRFLPKDRELYEIYLSKEEGRGCEFSFANLYLWGHQSFALIDEHIVFFSQFDRKSVYPYPLGDGNKKKVIDAVIADSKARGIPCRITGISVEARQTIEELYPEKFRFHCDEGSFDYVYSIDDLADLKGKKYHGKRNHFRRFCDAFPNYTVEPIGEDNICLAREMVSKWYKSRLEENPHADYQMEQAAIEKAFRDYSELGMDGLLLLNGEDVLAITMGSRLSSDTFDVQFEKARHDIQGAYAAINREFAQYIRSKYPDIRFLDREEDMGIEGVRKAKKSYYPHHMIEKYWAHLVEDGYDY